MNNTTSLVHDLMSAAVPAWVEAHAAAERLETEVRRRIADRTDGVEDRNDATDALRAATDPAGMQSICDAARLGAARREAETADLGILTLARDRAQSAVKNIEESSGEVVVDEIRDRVEAIASKVNGLRHRPLSAQQAINLDAAQEWKTLQQLAQEWQSLTRAYMTLLRREVDGPGVSALASAAFTGNPLETHPYFQARRMQAGKANERPRPDSFHEAQLAWSAEAPAPQFNTDEPKGTATPAGTDAIKWLVYLVERDALIVYGPAEALDIWAAAVASTDPITAHSAESHAQARVHYSRAVGDDDLTMCQDLRPLVEQGKRRPARGSFFG